MKKLIILLLLLRGYVAIEAQCISGNCINGQGTAIFKKKGNIRFTGQFLNEKPHGHGVAEYPNGMRYEGLWRNGTMDGLGTLTHNGETLLNGVWYNSRFLYDPSKTALADKSEVIRPEIVNPTHVPTVVELTERSKPIEETISIKPDFLVYETGKNTSDSNPKLHNNVQNSKISKVWTLSVGVSNYESPSVQTLKYPHSDAFRMYAFWKSPEGGSLDDRHSQVLVNDQATKQGILDSMRQMFMQADENDLVAFFYSGHGLKGAFLPTDYDNSNHRLFHSEVNDLLGACPAKYKLVIADACNSGSYLASKSVNNEIFPRSQQDVQDGFFRELNRASPGTAFILSSQADEESLEVSSLHQSIFSYFVLRGMKGEANVNEDDVVTVQELFDYVYRKVTSYALSLGKIQTPVIKGNYDPNMPVAMVRKN